MSAVVAVLGTAGAALLWRYLIRLRHGQRHVPYVDTYVCPPDEKAAWDQLVSNYKRKGAA